MNSLSLFIILLSCFLIGACASSKKEEQDDLTSANSADSTDQTMPKKPEPTVAPAPGTVLVTAEIASYEQTSKGFHCNLKITAVHKYGASTPVLSQVSEVTALITEETLQAANPDVQPSKMLASAEAKELTLKYQQAPQLPGIKATSWRIISIR